MRVILVTDGDQTARRALELAASRLGLRCISASAGNPTPLCGDELVRLITEAAYDPVLVMLDDRGDPGTGPGETALAYLCNNPQVVILGAIAVASNTSGAACTPVDLSVTREGRVVGQPVDKNGLPVAHCAELRGDTVGILRELDLPVVVGIGDPGKMAGADAIEAGCAVTSRAIIEVLTRAIGPHPFELDQG